MVYSPRVLRVRYDQELSPFICLSLGTRIYFDTNLCLQQQTQYHEINHLSESSIESLKKNQNAPRPSEHPPVRGKMSKRLDGIIIGCKYKTSSWP